MNFIRRVDQAEVLCAPEILSYESRGELGEHRQRAEQGPDQTRAWATYDSDWPCVCESPTPPGQAFQCGRGDRLAAACRGPLCT